MCKGKASIDSSNIQENKISQVQGFGSTDCVIRTAILCNSGCKCLAVICTQSMLMSKIFAKLMISKTWSWGLRQ